MITKFGTLFAGHVDMEPVGLSAPAVNDRLYPNDHLITAFTRAEEMARLMDDLGFHALWLAEHHFQREGYECIPNILMLAMHLANITKKLKFGSGFNVTTMWHPLRLAEDYATADVLTKGRVIFGVGRGYHTREVEVFGAPLLDQDANRDLFEEQIDIMFKAFNEESFSHHGQYYDIPAKVPYRGYDLEDITLVPRPVNLPVECWQPIVSGNPRGLNFMAKHGFKGVIGGGVAQGGASSKVVTAWQDTLAAHGRQTELGGDLLMGFSLHIAETPEKAIAEARDYYYEDMKMFAPLNMRRGITPEQIALMGDPEKAPLIPDLPRIEDDAARGGWLCGPPEFIIEQLKKVQEMYPGLEHVNVGSAIGTPHAVVMEQLERFGKEVMPAFIGQAEESKRRVAAS